jgi:hypothetical protein
MPIAVPIAATARELTKARVPASHTDCVPLRAIAQDCVLLDGSRAFASTAPRRLRWGTTRREDDVDPFR